VSFSCHSQDTRDLRTGLTELVGLNLLISPEARHSSSELANCAPTPSRRLPPRRCRARAHRQPCPALLRLPPAHRSLPDHSGTLDSRDGLAVTLRSAGRFDEAIAGYEALASTASGCREWTTLTPLPAEPTPSTSTRHNVALADEDSVAIATSGTARSIGRSSSYGAATALSSSRRPIRAAASRSRCSRTWHTFAG
jgi:hypothetical protein